MGLDYTEARRRVLAAVASGEAERRAGIAAGLEELAREVRAGEHNELVLVQASRLLHDGAIGRARRAGRR